MNKTSVFAISACLFALFALCALPAFSQPRVQVLSNAVTQEPLQADTSAPLSSLPVTAPKNASPHIPLRPKRGVAAPQFGGSGLQTPVGASSVSIGLNFDGVSGDPAAPASENCPAVSGSPVFPSDSNLSVGDTQVVQWVNLCYSIFDKKTGALIAGPFPGNHFWSGFGGDGECEFFNDGDPIIQWDKANHVWVATQNVFHPDVTEFFRTCIAISTSSDATGSYHRYSFIQPLFPDYPKWGLTPNVYYQTQNMFDPVFLGYLGVNVCAYDGAAMRKGAKNAKQMCILDNSNLTYFDDSLLPADSDEGSASSPEVLLGSVDNPGFNSEVYKYVFKVNFRKGTATLAGVDGSMPITVTAFTLGCGGCAAQPGTTTSLEVLGDRLLYRLARFDDGTTQHFLVNHTVNNTAAVAARWYEFTAPHGSTNLTLAQTGETPDDGVSRWMGSIARDKFGNIALGYSRSSATDFPSIYISGQTAGEPAGTTNAEVVGFAGNGSQTDSGARWGDYSSMALDGADHCTFWYTNEYLPVTNDFQWYTRLIQLKYPGCP